jgi:hypothetical protein
MPKSVDDIHAELLTLRDKTSLDPSDIGVILKALSDLANGLGYLSTEVERLQARLGEQSTPV